MKAWFFSLQPRERWILGVGAAAAVAIVLFGLVLKPLRTQTATLRTSVETKQRLLTEVTRLESVQPASAASNIQGAGQTLVRIVNDTARTHGLDLPRTRQNGPSGIDVTLQSASFDVLVAWLVALQTSYGISVETASLSTAREPGLVNGQISLHRL